MHPPCLQAVARGDIGPDEDEEFTEARARALMRRVQEDENRLRGANNINNNNLNEDVNNPFILANLHQPIDAFLGDADAAEEEDGDDLDDDPGLEDIPPMGDGEIRFAVDELLGLRGFTHLLRNAWLLLAFNCVYIGLFASFPYLLGLALIRFGEELLWVQAAGRGLKLMLPSMVQFVQDVVYKSAASGDALQFLDVILIAIGYLALFAMVFLLSESVRRLREISAFYYRSSGFLNVLVTNLTTLANFVKVGLLLFIRVFSLPITLGMHFIAAKS